MTYEFYACTARVLAVARSIQRCPCCRRRTRHVVQIRAWYDPSRTCGACGAEDGRRPGRYEIGREQIAPRARAAWKKAVTWKRALDILGENA